MLKRWIAVLLLVVVCAALSAEDIKYEIKKAERRLDTLEVRVTCVAAAVTFLGVGLGVGSLVSLKFDPLAGIVISIAGTVLGTLFGIFGLVPR